ncbi:MAG: hypothetical protein H7144_03200, partial [Burkholderiales bacterium]|nr:hypothetical protein [Phycisphaerae bacterium]
MSSTAHWLALLPDARRRLMTNATVTGVGLGCGHPEGRSDERVWRVYVSSALASLPASLFGLRVETFGMRTGRAATKTPTVYTAGMQIESKLAGSGLTIGSSNQGALGCFAKDSAGKPVLLTNSHVMFPHYLALSHLGVYQPDYSSCCSGGDKIATAVFDPAKVIDGKYKGGFKEKLGIGYIPGPFGPTKSGGPLHCSETDCAIARLDPGVQFRNVLKTPDGEIAINGINDDVLSVLGPSAGTAPAPDQYVRIFTPRDGGKLIYGTLTWTVTEEIPDSIEVNGIRLSPIFRNGFVIGSPEDEERAGSFPSINQFIILPRPKPIPGEADYKKFYAANQELSFNFGDSGSVVIDHLGRVIAQIIGGFPFVPELFVRKVKDRSLIEFTAVGNVAIASPIRGIIEQLDITIPAAGFAGTVPASAERARASVPGFESDDAINDRQIVERLREHLRPSRRGRFVLGKISQHRREIRDLLERVRAVSAAWRDLQ